MTENTMIFKLLVSKEINPVPTEYLLPAAIPEVQRAVKKMLKKF